MRCAALDLGSNSFLCLITEVFNGGDSIVLSDQQKVVKLGEGLSQSGFFMESALKRAEDCLIEFANTIEHFKPDKIQAVATAAARRAHNIDRLFAITNKLNIPLKIISGQEEADWTWLGSIQDQDEDLNLDHHTVLIDMGGASTELVLGIGSKRLKSVSLPFGVVLLTEMFREKRQKSYPEFDSAIRQEVGRLAQNEFDFLRSFLIQKVVGVAGTPTSLASILAGGYSFNGVHGYKLNRIQLRDFAQKFFPLDAIEISRAYGLELGRSEVIGAGTVALDEMLRMLSKEELLVSAKGLRFGVARLLEQGIF